MPQYLIFSPENLSQVPVTEDTRGSWHDILIIPIKVNYSCLLLLLGGFFDTGVFTYLGGQIYMTSNIRKNSKRWRVSSYLGLQREP